MSAAAAVEQIRVERSRAEQIPNLRGFSVEMIDRNQAESLIVQHEWLGNIGKSTIFVGLLSPTRELHGVACFGYGPSGDIRQKIGSPAWCLERGACTPTAPPNAASYLINNACKLVYRITGTARFFAYADPGAGEFGAVYQASGWVYLGQGLNGHRRRHYVLPPGGDPDSPASTTRALRRDGHRMSFAQARALGWRIAVRDAKHVYATPCRP